MQYVLCYTVPVCSAVSDSLQPCGLYSPPGSSVRGILQARILEWVVISFSKGCSWPRGQTGISCLGRWILFPLPPRKPAVYVQFSPVQ